MSRVCSICTSVELAKQAEEMITAGESDVAIGRALGVGRMSVSRHRTAHVLKPLSDRLAIVAKAPTANPQQVARHAAREREQVAAAAASDAPSPVDVVNAALGAAAQAAKLQAIEARLERVAGVAEAAGQVAGVAAVAGQQIRAVEVGAKLSGAGGYGRAAEGAHQGVFSVVINLGGDHIETIARGGPVLDLDADSDT